MSFSVETPVYVLFRSLARGGWGAFAGAEWQGVRSTLGALVARSGRTGLEVTVWQVAQAAGLSEKWTSRCMAILEGLGVIRWTRGEIRDGRPLPGYVQIMKRVLLDLISQAWKQGDKAWAARRVATARRLALLKTKTACIRRSRRVELSGDHNSAILSTPSRVERELHRCDSPGFVSSVKRTVETPVEDLSIKTRAWFAAHPKPNGKNPQDTWAWLQALARVSQGGDSV